jgi:hypothetical protein
MPLEITDLPAITSADDADLLIVYDVSAPSAKSKKITKASLLSGFVKSGDNCTLGDLTAGSVAAATGAINTLTVSIGLSIGASLSRIGRFSGNVTFSTLAAGAGETVTAALTGAVAGDFVVLGLPVTLPAGLIVRGDIGASNVLSLRAFNASGASISGASYAITAVTLRVS